MSVHDDLTQQLAPDDRLNEAVLDYLHALEQGQPPDREAWLQMHPEFAGELRQFLAGMDQFRQVVGPLLVPAPHTVHDGSGTVEVGREPALPGAASPVQ